MENAGDIIKHVGHGSDAVNKLIQEALALEFEDAKVAGALGFMARALVQVSPGRFWRISLEPSTSAYETSRLPSWSTSSAL